MVGLQLGGRACKGASAAVVVLRFVCLMLPKAGTLISQVIGEAINLPKVPVLCVRLSVWVEEQNQVGTGSERSML